MCTWQVWCSGVEKTAWHRLEKTAWQISLNFMKPRLAVLGFLLQRNKR